MSDAERIVAKAIITVDGIPGIEVLAVCNQAGEISLICDGHRLADSTDSEENNLLNLRTARGAAFHKLPGLLSELERGLADAGWDRKNAAELSIQGMIDLLKRISTGN